jgi:hypothetical protein
MSRFKFLALFLGVFLTATSQSQTSGKDPDYCDRLIHDKLMAHPSANSTQVIETDETNTAKTDNFVAEEKRLYALNTASVYRKIATLTYHPDNTAGMYSLQMGAGQAIYVGNSLQTLTRRMNSASTTMPGETVYVKLVAPPDHLEALQQSLKMQQSVVGDGVQVMPLSGEELDAEATNLLFAYPVKDIKRSEVSPSAEKIGWVQATLDFIVDTGRQGLKHVRLTILARSADILANIMDAMHVFLIQQRPGETRSVTEIVDAARVKALRDHRHVADLDYLMRVEVGHSFMVSLQPSSMARG